MLLVARVDREFDAVIPGGRRQLLQPGDLIFVSDAVLQGRFRDIASASDLTISFANPRAEALVLRNHLTPGVFEHLEPSSLDGFTEDDVQALIDDTVRCSPTTPACGSALSTEDLTSACCRQHRLLLLNKVGAVLEDAGVPWWMDYGTLLGSEQNLLYGEAPGMLPFDVDVDLSFLAEDHAQAESVVREMRRLERDGHVVDWRPGSVYQNLYGGGDMITIWLSRHNKNRVEVFPWFPNETTGTLSKRSYKAMDRFKGREFSDHLLFPIGTSEFEGQLFPRPANPEGFLEMRYGPGWHIRTTDPRGDGVLR